MKIYYHGPRLKFGQAEGLWGELRVVSLQGLWQKVQRAKLLGERLAHVEMPVMEYLRKGKRERLDCLLCGHRLRAQDRWVDMIALVIPYEPTGSPVLVSALCHPCCAAEPDDIKLLAAAEAVLQRHLVLGLEQTASGWEKAMILARS